MYPPLKLYLERLGYTVYPEIEPRTGGPRADIVAVKDDQVLIVEMKTSFGLAVMEQADHWASGGHAHQTYIAVPWRDVWQVAPIAKRALEQVGVGILRVDLRSNPNSLDGLEERLAWIREKNEQRAKEYRDRIKDAYQFFEDQRVTVHLESKPNTEAIYAQNIIDMLTPHHLNGPDAGGKAGGHISAHKLTMIRAEEYLALVGDWVTPKQICENIETHYCAIDKSASLKQALLQWGTEFCEYQVINRRGMFRIKDGERL